MSELVNAFRRFLSRDLIFLISGGAVVGTSLHLFDRLPTADSWVLFGLLGGVGYFLAYALQDALCLTRLITTTAVELPGPFVQWMYRRYTHVEWPNAEAELQSTMKRATDEEKRVQFERIVMFQLVGTTGGPCLIASGVLFLFRFSRCQESFDLFAGVSGVALGLLLICLGWLKGAQRARLNAICNESSPPAV